MNKKYDMTTFTIEDMKELIYNGDDSHNNQIRVTNDGYIFLSEDKFGNEALENIRFYGHTFVRNNDYVGPNAAESVRHITYLYTIFTNAWNSGIKEAFVDEAFTSIND